MLAKVGLGEPAGKAASTRAAAFPIERLAGPAWPYMWRRICSISLVEHESHRLLRRVMTALSLHSAGRLDARHVCRCTVVAAKGPQPGVAEALLSSGHGVEDRLESFQQDMQLVCCPSSGRFPRPASKR